MAPAKKNVAPKAKKVDRPKPLNFGSPTIVHRLKVNRKSHVKSAAHMMIAITLEEKAVRLTPEEEAQLERVKAAIDHPFEDLALCHRHHLRQQRGLTALSQTQWETLTRADVVKSVVINQPLPVVGELLKKASPFERDEFYKVVLASDKKIHKAASEARTAAKKTKKVKKA